MGDKYKKVKKFAVKHGKKIGGAALTAVKQTASTFGPGKKVKVAYKAGKAVGVVVKKLKNVWKQPTKITSKEDVFGKFLNTNMSDKTWKALKALKNKIPK